MSVAVVPVFWKVHLQLAQEQLSAIFWKSEVSVIQSFQAHGNKASIPPETPSGTYVHIPGVETFFF